METLSVSDLISAYSKFTEEAIEEYAEKHKISSISVEDLKLLSPHVAAYCLDKVNEKLIQVKELNNEAEIRPDIQEEEKEEKCKDPAPIHQSSTSEVKELNNEAEITPDILEEEKDFEQEKCKDPAPAHQSSTSEISVDLFMKFMTEHQKQHKEYQNIVLTIVLEQMKHQNIVLTTVLEQMKHQQQQNRFHEQVLQQQQDYQSRLMGDYMKHSEKQTTLLCQALSNFAGELSQHDDHLNKDIKDMPCHESRCPEMTKNFNGGDNSFSGRASAKKMESISHFQDMPSHESRCPEMTKNFNGGDNSFSGRASAKKMESISHFQVSKRDKQPFQLFDCHQLGQDFCNWFFSLLNCQNPDHGQERLAWDPLMFWNDVTLFFTNTNENSHERYNGDECVSSKLLEMMQKEKLIFTPVLDSERFKCVNSRHGLVVVAVTGIISCTDKGSNVFNQIFGLIKCPSTGNYKIKSMTLKLGNMNPLNSVPNFHVPPLEYTTEQLQDFQL
ncbi:uncharacterized protein [Phyllobates terribilis]|uniref:uncharacterized protein isoform X3 n=1 Tax=Phyllobates terribilis TaxID=111132 RepID=UPI003CCB6996